MYIEQSHTTVGTYWESIVLWTEVSSDNKETQALNIEWMMGSISLSLNTGLVMLIVWQCDTDPLEAQAYVEYSFLILNLKLSKG
jgi:hypothetical protein